MAESTQKLSEAAPALLAALKATAQSLQVHLADEAQREKVAVASLCPCEEDVLTPALALIRKLEED